MLGPSQHVHPNRGSEATRGAAFSIDFCCEIVESSTFTSGNRPKRVPELLLK